MRQLFLDRIRPGWRRRRKIRKSPWHFIKLILYAGVLITLLLWVLLPLVWELHTYFHPDHAGQQLKFWNRTTDSISERIAAFLMLVPTFVLAVLSAMLLSNLILYCIPPARRAFEQESEMDNELRFKKSMNGLLKILFWVLVPAIPLIIYGAASVSEL